MNRFFNHVSNRTFLYDFFVEYFASYEVESGSWDIVCHGWGAVSMAWERGNRIPELEL